MDNLPPKEIADEDMINQAFQQLLNDYLSTKHRKKVEIITKSYRDGAQAVKWTCDGSPEFTIEEVEKADRG